MVKKTVKIKINDQEIVCEEGKTIFEVAAANGIEIPTLCEHPDFPHKANCRVCAVEVKGPSASSGRAKLVPACSVPVRDGMEVITASDRVKRSRNLNLEMIFAEHVEKCATCVWRLNCKLLAYAEKFKIPINRFKDRKGDRPIYKFSNAVEIDGTQCIDCRNCIDACSLGQNINYLELRGKGLDQEVAPVKKKGVECILCGQCAVHCPVSAAQEQAHWQEVEKALKEKKKRVVALLAPYVRISLCEDFKMNYGELKAEQLAAALKFLGFSHVFDLGASLPALAAAQSRELIKGEKGRRGPLLSSCCPAWVRYVEFYRPDLVKNLATAKAPQVASGEMIKAGWAEKNKFDPRDILVVSISPCTAKKFETTRREAKIKGRPAVDIALTTREIAWLFKKNNLDLAGLKAVSLDKFDGEAVTDYPGSGQIMLPFLDKKKYYEKFAEEGSETFELKIGKKKFRFCRVNGIRHAQEKLKELDTFDYLEVLACPGGCIGGGGEPIPTTRELVCARAAAMLKTKAKK